MHQNQKNSTFFLHGLDSSSRGTKGQWFAKHCPEVSVPDFYGELSVRLAALENLCSNCTNITLVGSSFGGLMATCFAIKNPEKCRSLILLAPALNFPEYTPPPEKITIPTIVIIGDQDTVTPPEKVLPLARESFSSLEIVTCKDDHMLHNSFEKLYWHDLLQHS